MDSQKIGRFLRELRKEKNLTQEQLAEVLNVSGRSVSRWETGTNMPDISIMIELSEYYGIDIKELLNGERKSEMNNELKETLRTVADYTDSQKKEAVRASNYGFALMFMACAVAIVIQMIMFKDMKLVVGETVALLVGGITNIGILVKAGAFEYPRKRHNAIMRDLFISVVCAFAFSIVLFLVTRSADPVAATKFAVGFFVVMIGVCFGVLRVLAVLSGKNDK